MAKIHRVILASALGFSMVAAPAAEHPATVGFAANYSLVSTDGSDPKNWDLSRDGVMVAPKSHKVVYEDAMIRVVSVTVSGGAKEPYHVDPYWAVVVNETAPVKLFDRDASGREAGHWAIADRLSDPAFVTISPPGAMHSIRNPGATPNRVIRVEFKTGIVPRLIQPDWPPGKVPLSSDGSDPKHWDPKLEGKVGAPENHKAVYEDDDVCVQTVAQLPGYVERLHDHPYQAVMVFYGELPSLISNMDAGGTVSRRDTEGAGPFGMVRLIPPEALHATTNDGTQSAPIIRIDFKKGFPKP